MPTNISLYARYLLVAVSLAGATFSFVLARAAWLFQQDTAASVPAAVKLVPFDSAYLARLAAWKPAEKVVLLQRAVKLNPFDSESWIQLGFASEFQQHDAVSAERYFLQAADVNQMFLPKWTLTNFYFRHSRTADFFRWARATLAITPYSPEPVFVQMWLVTQDAEKIAAAVPDRPRALLPYAWFLSNSGQHATLPGIVQRLINAVGNHDPRAWGRDDLLAAIEDRLISGGEQAPALRIWESMVHAGWLKESIPTAEHPVINGDFRALFFRHGFDWIPASVDGVRVDQSPDEGSLHLQFSGQEPERFVLLRQYLPLNPGQVYRFRWQTEMRLAESPSGLAWHLRPVGVEGGGGESSSADLALSAAGDWQVRAPAANIGLLTLEYERPPGELRARGAVILKSVTASVAGAPSTLNH